MMINMAGTVYHPVIALISAERYPWEPVNIGRQKNRGLDISLRRKLSPQWDVSAGYSYVKKENQAGDAGYEDDAGRM